MSEDIKVRLRQIYEEYNSLEKVEKSLLRRAVEPKSLLEIPIFYRFYRKYPNENDRNRLLRIVFCLSYLTDRKDSDSLGAALSRRDRKGRPRVSQKRVVQVTRIQDDDGAMVQLRRIIKQAAGTEEKNSDVHRLAVDWEYCGMQLWYWNKRSKQKLLEDYFLGQSVKEEGEKDE